MTNNKTAVITGAGKGIGKAIALGLAKLNFQTILLGRTSSFLEEVAGLIQDTGGIKPIVAQTDISDTKMLKDFLRSLIREIGRIDVLVNNAGMYLGGTLELLEVEFEQQLTTNLTAQYVVLKEIVPLMKAQKSGYIFNVASRAGKIGFANSGAYSASKFGLVGLSESLYRELNPLGIRVTTLCPGWVNTRMAYEAGTPLKDQQMIQPEDLFKTIEWLLGLSSGVCVKEVILETPYSIS